MRNLKGCLIFNQLIYQAQKINSALIDYLHLFEINFIAVNKHLKTIFIFIFL